VAVVNERHLPPVEPLSDDTRRSTFGLAYLLGIQLMPRIRHWKELKFVPPS
jgi:TnpA family transposase